METPIFISGPKAGGIVRLSVCPYDLACARNNSGIFFKYETWLEYSLG